MSFKQSVSSTKAVLLLSELLFCNSGLIAQARLDRLNIVWLVSEDSSTHYLEPYDGGEPIRNVEGLAEKGNFFTGKMNLQPRIGR